MAIPDDEKKQINIFCWFLANFSPFCKISLFNMMRIKAYLLGISRREEENI